LKCGLKLGINLWFGCEKRKEENAKEYVKRKEKDKNNKK